MSTESNSSSSGLKALISGGAGGVCLVLVGHPLDTIKVRLQTQATSFSAGSITYSGTWDCFRKTLAHEGIRGLYKGMSAPLVGVTPICAISFGSYDLGKRLQTPAGADGSLSLLQVAYAGMLSGFCTTVVMSPGERMKCLLQIQAHGGVKRYNGLSDCFMKILKAEGVFHGLYKGSCATMLRDMPANAAYFATYEALIRMQSTYGSRTAASNPLMIITAGGVAGIAFWIIGIVPDTLKSRLQTAPEGRYKNGIRSVFSEIMRTEGPQALFKGLTPVLVRAFPANAACFLGFESAMSLLNYLAPNW